MKAQISVRLGKAKSAAILVNIYNINYLLEGLTSLIAEVSAKEYSIGAQVAMQKG